MVFPIANIVACNVVRMYTRSPITARAGLAKLPLLIGAALAAVATFAGVFAWLMSVEEVDPSTRLNAALRLLKKGKSSEAQLLVGNLDDSQSLSPAEQSKQNLIMGAAALDNSERGELPQQVFDYAVEAEKKLAKANDLGFPRGYEGYGNFLLGKVLFQLFRWDDAREPLEIAVTEWPNGRSQALSRLVDIALDEEPIDQQEVDQRLSHWAGLAGLTDDERDLGLVKRVEASIALGHWDEAIQGAEAVPTTSSFAGQANFLAALAGVHRADQLRAAVVPDRRMMLQSQSSRMKQSNSRTRPSDEEYRRELERASQVMAAVAKDGKADRVTRRRSEFFLGTLQRRLGQPLAALNTFQNLQQKSPNTLESIVAGIEEMEVLLEQGQYGEVAASMQRIDAQLGSLDWYRNAWFSFEEMGKRLLQIGKAMVDRQAYAEVLELTEHWPAFGTRVGQLQLQAEASRRWAELLSNGSESASDAKAIDPDESDQPAVVAINQEKQRLYAKAAQAYEELAAIELRGPSYFDLIWAAIDCAQAAGELKRCNEWIRRTMEFEPRDNHPRSLLKIAENYFAMQENDHALDVLKRCTSQFPEHPVSYQARLNMARILHETGDYSGAVEELEDNLYLGKLTPESPVWRESLFELGKSFFEQGEAQYNEAQKLKESGREEERIDRVKKLEASYRLCLDCINKFEEWIRRFPDDSRRFDTLYNVGQAYQMAAQWPKLLMDTQQLPSEELKRTRQAEYQQLLDVARQTYRSVREGMNSSKDWSALSPAEQRLMRNSYFAEADLLLQARNYDGALTTYRGIANYLLNEPESLEALVQAAECLRALGRVEERIGVVDQAKEVLQRIPSDRDPDFAALTRFSRGEWANHLTQLRDSSLGSN
jgi:tetratricopeptide (TPR) repeat protein